MSRRGGGDFTLENMTFCWDFPVRPLEELKILVGNNRFLQRFSSAVSIGFLLQIMSGQIQRLMALKTTESALSPEARSAENPNTPGGGHVLMFPRCCPPSIPPEKTVGLTIQQKLSGCWFEPL